jgi:hypothetical protein
LLQPDDVGSAELGHISGQGVGEGECSIIAPLGDGECSIIAPLGDGELPPSPATPLHAVVKIRAAKANTIKRRIGSLHEKSNLVRARRLVSVGRRRYEAVTRPNGL